MTTSEPDIRSGKGPYELFMLALCVIALALLAAQAAFPLDPEVRALFGYIDAAICVGFLIDFGINFARAENKLRFMKWGWIDLISSIPTFDPLRWGRAFRIARALRLLRGVKAARMLSTALLERRAESTFLAVSIITLLLVLFGSVAILEFERVEGSNITSPEDALWWAATTVTTVGYGDRFPVTAEGRILAALLMVAGVGLFGTFTAFVASWFMAPAKSAAKDSEFEALRREVASLAAGVRELSRAAGRTSAPPESPREDTLEGRSGRIGPDSVSP